MRIAYFLASFPLLSETFISAQVAEVMRQGHEVVIHVDGVNMEGARHPHVDELGMMRHIVPRPIVPESFPGYLKVAAGQFLRHGWRAPLAFLRANTLTDSPPWYPTADLRFKAMTLAGRPACDIAHAHFGPAGEVAATLRLAGLLRSPLLVSFHGFDVNQFPREQGEDCYARTLRSAAGFTANTSFTANKAVSLGCDPNRMHLLPESLPLADFTPRRTPEEKTAPHVLTVARLSEKKGLEYSIRAVASLAGRFPKLVYTIIGEGDLRRQLEGLVRDLGVEDTVRLVGAKAQEEVRAAFDEAQVFVLASVTASSGDMEGQALVLQEAQAMQVPVVSTLHNGIPDGVVEGETGFLVAERDVEALSDRIGRLLGDGGLRARMGRAGRDFVAERYDAPVLARRLVDIYQSIRSA